MSVNNKETEIKLSCFTHRGTVRKDNQDNIRTCSSEESRAGKTGYLYAIADGMGGFAHGGIASSVALDIFFKTFYSTSGSSIRQRFKTAIQAANVSIFQLSQRINAGRMGTTLTAVNIIGSSMYVGHVGDCRAYLISNGKSKCLTNDHTRVGEMVRYKIIPPEKLRTHSQRSILNKSLGLELFVQPDIFKVQVKNGDIVVLCSDGVWSVIEDDEFSAIINKNKNDEKISSYIGALAMQRNSDDNVSVVVIYLNKLSSSVVDNNERNGKKILENILRRIKTKTVKHKDKQNDA